MVKAISAPTGDHLASCGGPPNLVMTLVWPVRTVKVMSSPLPSEIPLVSTSWEPSRDQDPTLGCAGAWSPALAAAPSLGEEATPVQVQSHSIEVAHTGAHVPNLLPTFVDADERILGEIVGHLGVTGDDVERLGQARVLAMEELLEAWGGVFQSLSRIRPR